MSLSAVLRQHHHSTRIAVVAKPADTLAEVEAFRPGLVCFSFTNCEQAWVLAAASEIKRAHPNLLIAVGGPHPTLHAELALKDPIDIVNLGEGEGPLLELVEALSRGEDWQGVRNLCFIRDGALVKNEVRP